MKLSRGAAGKSSVIHQHGQQQRIGITFRLHITAVMPLRVIKLMLKWSGQREYIKSLEQVKNGENEQDAQSCCPQIPAQLTTDSTRGATPTAPAGDPSAFQRLFTPEGEDLWGWS